MSTKKVSTPPSATPLTRPINVQLTIDDRDAIDGAKGRIRRLVHVALCSLEGDGSDGSPEPEDLLELLSVIVESLDVIDTTFKAADVKPGHPSRD